MSYYRYSKYGFPPSRLDSISLLESHLLDFASVLIPLHFLLSAIAIA